MQYIVGVIGRTWWQLSQLFAVPIVLAMALQWVGGQIRRCGAGWLGDTYWYIVSPGVACHETGHAVGCLISGCKIHEFVPFTRRYDDKLGYVTHERKRGLWGGVASFIISSGPVWFGCLMICSNKAMSWIALNIPSTVLVYPEIANAPVILRNS